MTSHYLESTPILSLAERRAVLEREIDEVSRAIDFYQGEKIRATNNIRERLKRIGALRAQLANISED